MRENSFKVLAACCLLACLYHLYGIFNPEIRVGYSWQRHLFFILLNVVVAYFIINRTWYFVPFLIVLVCQQLYGHGKNLIDVWVSLNNVSIVDLCVVLFMPLLVFIYIVDLLYADKALSSS